MTSRRDSLDTVGTLLAGGEGRDAVHIALAPGLARDRLYPGQRVTFAAPGDHEAMARAAPGDPGVGLVDPYLPAAVEPGQRFWVFLLPHTVTGLRHAWTHPAYPDEGTPCGRG